jgi:ATP-dependent DNA helicase RecQ
VAITSQSIHEVLQKHWGYSSFLPLQEDAMGCVLARQDSVVVLPTGGGKSLCFQAPAMVLPGLALVVSPLISLMKDQVDALEENGIPAARLDSTQSPGVQNAVRSQILSGGLKLLYVSPERLVDERFLAFLSRLAVSLVAIDEAHCISAWGHDFRPEYRQLGILKQTLPGVAIHAYTATATEQVRQDIARQLRLQRPRFLVGSFDRPNLVYKAAGRDNLLGQVCDVLDRHRDESGIVYCIRRADVDELCAALAAKGYRVAPYHAGMEDEDRKRNQEAFIEERVQTIVATIAFGMGIDKSNVRYVVHAGMPKSLEHYQQETGRAGRDGLEAECCLFYSGGDFVVWKKILGAFEKTRSDADAPWQSTAEAAWDETSGSDFSAPVEDASPDVRQIALDKLRQMYDYCAGVVCRHKALSNYFGQDLDKDNCGACDVCSGNLDCVEDALIVAQKILSCVARLKQNFGAEYTVSVLMGSKEQRILKNGHDRLSTYGLLADQDKRVVRGWTEQLVGQGYLQKSGEYNLLQITEKGWRVLRGQETPRLLKPAKRRPEPVPSTPGTRDSWEGVDRELFETLRGLRRQMALEKNVPPYVVFSDVALRDMARRRPSTLESFLRVHGVGQVKCEQYGEVFLTAIGEHCREKSVTMDVGPPAAAVSSPSLAGSGSRTVQTVLVRERANSLFAEGRSIEEIAQTIGRAPSTTMQYLVEFIQREHLDTPYPWVDEKTFSCVSEAVGQVGAERLKPIFDQLGGSVSYDLIRICVACLRNVG